MPPWRLAVVRADPRAVARRALAVGTKGRADGKATPLTSPNIEQQPAKRLRALRVGRDRAQPPKERDCDHERAMAKTLGGDAMTVRVAFPAVDVYPQEV